MPAVSKQSSAGGSSKQASLNKSLQLKDFQIRLKHNIRSLRENFREIVRLAKVEVEAPTDSGGRQISKLTQHLQDIYEVEARAANIARAAEALLKLVSDLREFIILNDFALVNEKIQAAEREFVGHRRQTDKQLQDLNDRLAIQLADIECEYYNT